MTASSARAWMLYEADLSLFLMCSSSIYLSDLCCFSLQQTPEEELCNLLTNIVFSVLWSRSGLEGVEDVVWRERGQVFSVLTKLGSSCQLVRPPDDIKRRSVTKKFTHNWADTWKNKLNGLTVYLLRHGQRRRTTPLAV